jgi:hypothetical protein
MSDLIPWLVFILCVVVAYGACVLHAFVQERKRRS